MRLSRIETRGCRALAGLHLDELAPGLNVILGPNGSGKTSLLRFVQDLLDAGSRSGVATMRPVPAAGTVDLESRSGPVRLLRIPRPGHPDTVAVVAETSARIDQFHQSRWGEDSATVALLRFVESSSLHQTSALASLAAAVTERLCARELGPNWSLVRTANRSVTGEWAAAASSIAVLSRLAVVSDDGSPTRTLPTGDLEAIDANWRVVIGALARQREQLSLACEAHVRRQTRQQREWETQLRWLGELAVAQSRAVARCDADWQAADCDLREREAALCSAPAAKGLDVRAPVPSAAVHELDRSLDLLRQVLEDLAQDRLQVSLLMARSTVEACETLEVERRRIDGCEREVVGQMQRLRQRRAVHRPSDSACVCPTCGTEQASSVAVVRGLTALSELTQLRSELQRQLVDARDRLAETCCRIARLEQMRSRQAGDPAADRMRYDVNVLDEQIAALESRRQVDLAAWVIALRHEVGRRHDVLRQAGGRLATLTSGRYAALRWNAENAELLAEEADGDLTPVSALSRGTSEQVAMALRIALLQGLAELGHTAPVLWDEPLADSDEQRLEAAAALLAEFAGTDAQLLLLTCREHVAQALAAHGAAVHRIGSDVIATTAEPWLVVSDGTAGADAGQALPAQVPVRVHPDSAFWLRDGSPLEQAPSIGPQMARRLRAVGIVEISDLLEFDPGADSDRLGELQISVAQVRIWQAEARLLTQVAGLTGRDAQLLVSCGVLTREELAVADVEGLTRRIDRLRGGDTLRWRLGPSTAPHRETIERWVESARRQPPADPSTRDDARSADDPSPRRRSERTAVRRGRSSRPLVPANPPAVALRFRLQPDSPIVDAPSIGQKTGRRLQRIGIATVRDLLACDPQQTAVRLRHRRFTVETMLAWQRQAGLMCSVPELRCADAIVLVACGITGPLDLRRISAAALHATLGPFVAGAAGQRLLRGASPPTFEDVARWIETVEESRVRRAA